MIHRMAPQKFGERRPWRPWLSLYEWLTVLGLLVTIGCVTEPPLSVVTDTPDVSRAQRVLEAEGFFDIQMTGVSLVGCEKRDSIVTSETFRATSSGHKLVTGRVCCGLVFRGCHVRLD